MLVQALSSCIASRRSSLFLDSISMALITKISSLCVATGESPRGRAKTQRNICSGDGGTQRRVSAREPHCVRVCVCVCSKRSGTGRQRA